MEPFEPDLDYIVDLIADAYNNVGRAIESNELDRAEFWQAELESLVHGLRCYLARTL